MASCSFFGHREVYDDIGEILKSTITDLIKTKNVDVFYVGNQWKFDHMVIKVLKELKECYRDIKCYEVLAYMPKQKGEFDSENLDTIYPNVLEKTLPKYAIIKRNEWMVENSEYVITYVRYSFGGAVKFKDFAEKKNKKVINIKEIMCFD